MSQRDTIIHLVAGGIAGTTGAVVTCPLEVVKTRLQSSNPVFGSDALHPSPPHYNNGVINNSSRHGSSYRSYHGSSVPGPQLTPPKHKLVPGGNGLNGSGQQRLFSTCGNCGRSAQYLQLHHSSPVGAAGMGGGHSVGAPRIGLMQCLRLIIEKEGPAALFKGLGPNLVGVAPSRAIYFCSYSQSKKTYNQMFPADSPIVHIFSAATAGFVACTTTNPVWFVKTRLQLDQQRGLTARQTIRRIYAQGGLLGFYKGISASYMGISETVIHFVIYEAVKKRLQEWSHSSRASSLSAAASSATDDDDQDSYGGDHIDDKTSKDFLQFMAAGAFSKTVASCIAYPHEVARTRLREEGNKYHHLIQTLALVAKEEGWRGLYRGLATQLIRQIPNTAIMMSTYEAAVYLLTKYTPTSFSSNMDTSTAMNLLDNASSGGNNYDETFYADCHTNESDRHTQQSGRRLTV